MLTMRPSPAIGVPSSSNFEREVGNFTQRLPLFVSGEGRPMSCAQPSGTTGSTTIRVATSRVPPSGPRTTWRAGTLATIHRRATLRVSSRERTWPECRTETRP